jgi:hypothetical protein
MNTTCIHIGGWRRKGFLRRRWRAGVSSLPTIAPAISTDTALRHSGRHWHPIKGKVILPHLSCTRVACEAAKASPYNSDGPAYPNANFTQYDQNPRDGVILAHNGCTKRQVSLDSAPRGLPADSTLQYPAVCVPTLQALQRSTSIHLASPVSTSSYNFLEDQCCQLIISSSCC